jgi:hypothetical protein
LEAAEAQGVGSAGVAAGDSDGEARSHDRLRKDTGVDNERQVVSFISLSTRPALLENLNE